MGHNSTDTEYPSTKEGLFTNLYNSQSMSLFPVEMESERLRYERLHPKDFDPWELYEYANVDAPSIDEITEHVTWNPYTHPKEAFNWVEHCGEEFESGKGATYVLRPKDGEDKGELAGLAGLHPNWDLQLATLGTWLRKPFWGRGYSGERAAQMLEVAFEKLDLKTVAVTHDPANDKSEQAIEKYIRQFGGRREGRIRNDIVIDDEPRDSIRYSVTHEEWQQNHE